MKKPNRSLTRKQERFVSEYMVDLNATQAAIRAGYSERNADKIGPELLGKTRLHIDQALRELAHRTTMNADVVVDRLQRIANTDITDFLTWQGNTLMLKDPSEIPKELRQCIESVTQHETMHVKYLKIKLHSKVAALGMLAKYHNLFKRTVASKGLVVNIYLHEAAAPRAPVVINSPQHGAKTSVPSKVNFSFAPGARIGSEADAQPGEKSNGKVGNEHR